MADHRVPLVSVLTPTVPERAHMLQDAIASVAAQEVPHEHLILVDHNYNGCSQTVNRLAANAIAPWLLILADDDILNPGCLQKHLDGSGGGDIVYSPPRVVGEPEGPFHRDPPGIPSLSLIRRELWEKLGGYETSLDHCEDRDLYGKAVHAGARFVKVEPYLWEYRFHGANKSREFGGNGIGPGHYA